MNTMKSKHLLILLLSLFVFCFSSTVFANKAQDEAIDYLKQAVENTANAKNLTYKINLSMTSPLADGDIISLNLSVLADVLESSLSPSI